MEKSKSRRDKVGGGDGFQFVNLENPDETRTQEYRHRVRSHVASYQHRKARAKYDARGSVDEHANGSSGGSTKRGQAGKFRYHQGDKRRARIVEEHLESDTWPQETGPSRSGHTPAEKDEGHGEGHGCGGGELAVDAIEVIPRLAHSRAFSRGALSFGPSLLEDSENVVGSCLHHLGLDVSSVLVSPSKPISGRHGRASRSRLAGLL